MILLVVALALFTRRLSEFALLNGRFLTSRRRAEYLLIPRRRCRMIERDIRVTR